MNSHSERTNPTSAAPEDYREAVLKHMNALPLPSLGNPAKTYAVTLTEPEINALHSAIAYVDAGCRAAKLTRYWEHYGPTLIALSERLSALDDENSVL